MKVAFLINLRPRLQNSIERLIRAYIRIDPNQLKELRALNGSPTGKGRRVVYVLRYPSRIVTFILQYVCRIHGLPVSEDMISPKSALDCSDKHVTFALRRRSGDELLHRNLKHAKARLRNLFRSLSNNSPDRRSTLFVPVTLATGNGPKPLPIRMTWPFDFSILPLGEIWSCLVLLICHRSIRLELNLIAPQEPTPRPGELMLAVSRTLYFQEKRSRGARVHEQPTVKNIVLSGPQFEKLVRELSVKTLKSPAEIVGLAEKHFHSIEGTLSPLVITFCRKLLDWVFNSIFSEVTVHGIEHLRTALHGHPVILVPAHRSHFDYLLITYALHCNHLALPYIAAGDNLNFFPMGPLARRTGAFFIKRKLPDDPMYKLILDRYLQYLMKQGHTIEFFIEGGRSRDGSLKLPKLGLLKYLMRAIFKGSRRDINFVPVSINYERVAEDRSLTAELRGAQKRRESFWQLGRLFGIFRKNYGPVTIEFSPGFSLRSTLGERATIISERDQLSATELANATEEIGQRVMRAIEERLALTTSGITSSGLLTLSGNQATVTELASIAKLLIQWTAAFYGVNLFQNMNSPKSREEFLAHCPASPELHRLLSVDDFDLGYKESYEKLVRYELLPKPSADEVIDLTILDKTRLRYYRNSILGRILPIILFCRALNASGTTEQQIRTRMLADYSTLQKRCPIESFSRFDQQLPNVLAFCEATGILAKQSSSEETTYQINPVYLPRIERMLCVGEDLFA